MDARRIVGTAVAGLTLLGLASGCSSGEDKKDAAADVKVTSCTGDPGGGRPKAEGTIKNGTSKDSAYAFRVTFTDSSGNKVSDGAVTVAKVDAGGDATWDTSGVARAKGDVKCDVENVSRTAVP
jgi:hypothetical protein